LSWIYFLDAYPGQAGYSLQALRDAYTGSAIQVRRSSDGDLADIGFVANKLDIAGLQSWLGASDGYVRTWYDQQNANDATQTTDANQPKIATAGVVELLNGEPSIVFSGTQWLSVPQTVFNGQIAASVISMASAETVNNYEMLYTHSDGLGIVGRIEIRRNLTNDKYEYIFFSNAGATAGIATINNQQHLIAVCGQRSGTVRARIDGVADAAFAAPANAMGNYVSQIGARNGSFGYVGRIQEVLLYRANKNSQISGMETLILARY
jgi:hypothetical protein